MTELKATILGSTPSKSNCYIIITKKGKNGKIHGSLAKSSAIKKYEDNFYIQLPPNMRGLDIAGYFELEIDVYYPTERADLDNSLKIVLDCLQKSKTIRNDNKCIRIVANKAKDPDKPRIEFKIKVL